jgi:hypothetical protein
VAKAIRNFVFQTVIFFGALSCILYWAGIKPRDLWGWNLNVPHWPWLVVAILLFFVGFAMSGYNLYRSLKPIVKTVESVSAAQGNDSSESLRDRTFSLCATLGKLLDKHGPRPDEWSIPITDRDEFTRIYNETVQAWENKFQADYWKNYKEKIVDLRHEFALESLTDNELDEKIMEADTSALSDVTVKAIDKGLRSLAARLP